MFDDWKQAWRQAVENFQREAAEGSAPPRVRAMERELTSASGALAKLDQEIRRTRRDLETEREAEQVCRRREQLARDAGDDETVRIAVDFAARHAERSALLERKLGVLEDERSLLSRDFDAMKQVLADAAPAAAAAATSPRVESSREAEDVDFSRLEREARQRAADERLAELKRRMQN